MKKSIFIGLAVVLSIAICGLAVAEELAAKKEDAIAKYNEIVKNALAQPDDVSSQAILLSDTSCGPNKMEPETCEWLYGICCQASSYYDERLCQYYNPGTCGSCYIPCN